MHRDRTPMHVDHRGLVRLTVATLLALGLTVGPAVANDLSTSPCTAGDVEIVGSGLVVNEPCTRPTGDTFTASVQFVVRNNTNSGRYCVSLHLVADGVVLKAPLDVVLRDAKGSSTAPGRSGGERYHDTIMYGSIPGFSYNAGMVCFGEAGGGKGKCAPGSCTTVSWNTSPGASTCTDPDQNPPGGQCRHQQVCVVGFGATLVCKTVCAAACGDSLVLTACVIAPASRGPFVFELQGDDGSTLQSQSSFGDASGTTCLDFTVKPTKGPKTTYTLTVKDKDKCSRTATDSVDVAAPPLTLTPPSAPGCNGVLTYTASVPGETGCTFTWTVDGQSLATFLAGSVADDARLARVSGTGNATFEFRALDNTCHSIEASASCTTSGTPCGAGASATVKQCVTPTQACTK